ncbi:MAG: dienelactone hydrolase family protein [Pseudomonadales bacterium]
MTNLTTFNADVPTPDGNMDCFIAHPDSDGPFAPVILYMDVPGIREELRDFARRFASEGYLCVLPDLYYRNGKVRFDLSKGEAELQRMFAVGGALTNAMIVSDTQGILNYLQSMPIAQDKIGIVGHCMSGQFVLSVAGTFPERIKATAALYGTRMVTDKADSPHLLLGNVQGELYLGFAEHDPYVEDFVIPTLVDTLQEHGIDYRLEEHEGTEHGFCFPARPGYDAQASERVWKTLFDMFERQL